MNVTLRLKSAPTLRLRYQPGLRGPTGLTGSTGPTGPANTLTIGTVTALDYGEPAEATITGTAPNQVLNLGLPAGEQGPSGSVTDGDKGDIVVSSAGTVWTVDDGSITYAKLATVAEDRSQAGYKIEDVGDATAGTDALNRRSALALGVASNAPGFLFGLTLSNNGSDATNDIDIAAGGCSSNNAAPVNLTLAAALTKRLDAAWAVGTNQGGLDTGSIANTTYHVWLIRRSDTGVIDALFSTSASSPTMPTSYDQKRRIGSIIRASGAILLFTQAANEFTLTVPPVDLNTSQGTTSTLRALTVPIGIRVFARVAQGVVSTALSKLLLVSDPDLGTIIVTSTNATLGVNVQAGAGANVGANGMVTVRTNTSGQVRTVCDATHTITLATYGWTDDRGQSS